MDYYTRYKNSKRLYQKYKSLYTSESVTSNNIVMKEYEQNVEHFYNSGLRNTLSFFKIYKDSTNLTAVEGKTFYAFMRQLFTFDKNPQIRKIYFNKKTIIGYFIIIGLYPKFETFVAKLYDFYQTNAICGFWDPELHDKNSKKHYALLRINELVNEFLKEEVTISDIDGVTYKSYMTDGKSIELTLSKFIFNFVCTVSHKDAIYLMRYYLLSFILSEERLKYNIILDTAGIPDDTMSSFFCKLGFYEPLQTVFVYDVIREGKSYSFSTCGETTLLNLLNYLFINEDGNFVCSGYTKQLSDFYLKYPSMKAMIKDIDKTIMDWIEVVGNLENKSIYNSTGDIHNNLNNIIYVLNTVLNLNETDIEEIINKVSTKTKFNILEQQEDRTRFMLDDKLMVDFHPGHGELYYVGTGAGTVIKLPMFLDSIYKCLFRNISENEDFDEQMNNRVSEIKDMKLIPECIKDFMSLRTYLSTSTVANLQYFKNIDVLVIKNSDYYDRIDTGISELKKLKEIILDKTEIDDYVFKNENLEKLKISNYDSERISNILIKNLKELKITDSRINTLPEISDTLELLHLFNLKTITNLDSIKNLKSLQELIITQCRIRESLPDLGNLERLTKMDLSKSILGTIPFVLWSAVNLKSLILSGCQISSLPDDITNLTNLEKLNLGLNHFETIPIVIRKLKRLTYLSFFNNKIKTLPNNLHDLENLETLILDQNKITTFSSLCDLKNLKKLYISSNKIEAIPYEISNLKNLEVLFLYNNNIKKLPESIYTLDNLRKLFLSGNQIENIDANISNMKNLKVLDITSNRVTSVPKVIVDKIEVSY